MNTEFTEMIASLGDDRFANLPSILEHTAPEVSIRFNPRKSSTSTDSNDTTDSADSTDTADSAKVAWWPGGRYLAQRPKFTLDPAMHQGRYYVQDASSMILATVAQKLAERMSGETQRPLLWLDACAAPGGKTTAAIDALPAGSLVVANEYDYQRAEILKENVTKWGSPNVIVSRGDTARFGKLPLLFDVVAVDAPCSGEGMMRKDPVARQQWTPALVAECAERQREILTNLWETLRPGGYLVYSTCTFNTKENEEMVLWLIDNFMAESIDLGISFEGIDGPVGLKELPQTANLPALRFIPGRAKGEGLFLCVVKKPGDSGMAIEALPDSKKNKKQKGKPQKGNFPMQKGARYSRDASTPGPINGKGATGTANPAEWLSPDFVLDYSIISASDSIKAFPSKWIPLLPKLENALDIIAAGTELAEIKGRDVIPSHSLAMSTILNPSAFPQMELGKEEALRYLAREAITLPDAAPKGFVLLTFDGRPLGFVKNMGNRANNLYPKEWRIKNL